MFIYSCAINTDCDLVIDDVKLMTKPMVENKCNRMRMPVPWIFLLAAGFICADKCKMSKNYNDMKTSLQDGEGITAESFEDLYQLFSWRPQAL